MNTDTTFYLCPTCFYASEISNNSHEHALLLVNPGLLGDERRKPITDAKGQILSAAPRWFHEARVQARTSQAKH